MHRLVTEKNTFRAQFRVGCALGRICFATDTKKLLQVVIFVYNQLQND